MSRPPARIGLNLTAMIDVVFLLLVYFMAATEFRLGEEVYRLDLPPRGQSADPFELPREPLRIEVASTAGGYQLRLHGAPADPRTFQELRDFLAQSQRSAASLGGLFEPDHPIIIEPEPTARWAHAVEAFNAAARARYTNLIFSSRPGTAR